MEIDDWMLCWPMEHMEPANHTQPSTSRIIPRIVAGWNVVNTSLKSLGIELYHWKNPPVLTDGNGKHPPFSHWDLHWVWGFTYFLNGFSHIFPCFPMNGPSIHGTSIRNASKPTFQPQDRHVFVWTRAALEANLMFDHLIIIFPNQIGDHLCFLPHLYTFMGFDVGMGLLTVLSFGVDTTFSLVLMASHGDPLALIIADG